MSKLLYTVYYPGFLLIHHFPEGYFNLIRSIGLNDATIDKLEV